MMRPSERSRGQIYQDHDYHVYWEGLLFINGIPSGIESIKDFIKGMKMGSVEKACRRLKGIFFVFLEEKVTGNCYSFIDNSGLYHAYYSKNYISPSFLEIVRHERCSAVELDPLSVVEYIHFGNIFFGKTFFEKIKRIPGDKILRISGRDCNRTVIDKEISNLHEPLDSGKLELHEIFEGLAVSFENRKISIDLTGGIDSRLIALLLESHGIKFETAISCGDMTYIDTQISRRLASEKNYEWHCLVHTVASLESDIPELFKATEGLYDILYFHRLYQLQLDRQKRGIDIVISGIGGEFFKDLWWLQDFPFYGRDRSNIERLVDRRLMPFRSIDNILSDDYIDASRNLRTSTISSLKKYTLETNTRTYDNICLNFRMRDIGGRELTNYSAYLAAYAPFLDMDIIRFGVNLPVWMRVYNYFHRREITELNPDIARIPTTEGGMTVSSQLPLMLLDLPKYVVEKAGRLLVKMGLHRSQRFQYLSHPHLYEHARGLKVAAESLDILKNSGIVRDELRLGEIEDQNLGPIIGLGLFVDYLNSGS